VQRIRELPEAGSQRPEEISMNQFTQRVTLHLLRGYKWAVSPLFPPACRFIPTCSEYAMEAVERFGALRGGLVAVGRLLRCHPFVKGGYDPVIKDSIACDHATHVPRKNAPAHHAI